LGTDLPYFASTLAFGCSKAAPFNRKQVIRMTRAIPRRTVLASLVAVPAAAAFLSSCSDSGSAQAQTSSTASAAADAPQPAGTVDMAKLLEEGSLPEKILGEADAPVTIVEYACR
jgi:protein-disulfide isomerase